MIRPERTKSLIAGLALFVLVGCVFLAILRNGFINLDDEPYVTGNAMVQKGLTLEGLGYAFRSVESANWHPLTWLSHMMDCQFWGLRPAGHHLTSVLIHALNSALLFFVLNRMTGCFWRSLFVAALFGLHPLRVESVAWVAERKDVLSTCFFILTVGAYHEYEVRARDARAGRTVWLLASLGSYVLGLMSKPMLVSLPFLLLLLDYWPLRRISPRAASEQAQPRRPRPADRSQSSGQASADSSGPRFPRLLIEKIPFFAVAAASSVVTFLIQSRAGAVAKLVDRPMSERWANAVVSVARYCLRLVWPSNLSVFYPHPGAWPVWVVAASVLLMVTATVLAVLWRRSSPYLLMGWLWFLGSLVPVIGLVQVGAQSMADRYTYIPTIGLLIALVWAAANLFGKWKVAPMLAGAAGSCLVVACAIITTRQIGFWKDSGTLFARAAAVTDRNYLAYGHLGEFELFERHDPKAAIRDFETAISYRPAWADARNNLGYALESLGQANEAVPQLEIAVHLNPDFAEAHSNLGRALCVTGQNAEGMRHFREAIRLKPGVAEVHDYLGNALCKSGQVAEGISEFREAVRINPTSADFHARLASALRLVGNLKEAETEFQNAIRLKPADAELHLGLGNVLLDQGRREEAIVPLNQAIKLKPDSAVIHYTLARALFETGRSQDAVTQLKIALQLQPDYPEAAKALQDLTQRRP